MKDACKRIAPLLSGHHDGELSVQESSTVEEHLASCEKCREVLERYRTSDGILAEARPVRSEAEWEALALRVEKAVAEETAEPALVEARGPRPSGWQAFWEGVRRQRLALGSLGVLATAALVLMLYPVTENAMLEAPFEKKPLASPEKVTGSEVAFEEEEGSASREASLPPPTPDENKQGLDVRAVRPVPSRGPGLRTREAAPGAPPAGGVGEEVDRLADAGRGVAPSAVEWSAKGSPILVSRGPLEIETLQVELGAPLTADSPPISATRGLASISENGALSGAPADPYQSRRDIAAWYASVSRSVEVSRISRAGPGKEAGVDRFTLRRSESSPWQAYGVTEMGAPEATRDFTLPPDELFESALGLARSKIELGQPEEGRQGLLLLIRDFAENPVRERAWSELLELEARRVESSEDANAILSVARSADAFWRAYPTGPYRSAALEHRATLWARLARLDPERHCAEAEERIREWQIEEPESGGARGEEILRQLRETCDD